MGIRSIRWPLTGLLVFLLAACVLVAVGAYLFLQHWGRETPRPGQSRASLARPGEPGEDDLVLGVVFLRPGEDRQAALDVVKAKVQEINDTPGRLLPGVRLEPLWYRVAYASGS
jgi:hypothetical protein